jgi:hypothetical protein
MSDPLEQLLKRADEAVDLPLAPGNLAQRVRRKYRNQRVVRSFATVVAIVGFGILAISLPRNRLVPMAKRQAPPAEQPRFADTDAKVAELVAEQLEKDAAGKKRVAGPVALRPDVDGYAWALSEQQNRTALILVRSASQIYETSHDRSEAAAGYREAIRLFPQSPAAVLAEERLRELEAHNRDS